MKIVLASMGRCGSNMLFTALYNTFKDNGMYFNFHRDIDVLPLDSVIKTHDFANGTLDAKYIYLFGDPVAIACSVLAMDDIEFNKAHFINLHSEYKNPEESIILNDGMRLEENINSWLKSSCTILFIHYDVLWDSVEAISDFVGREIVLPEKIERLSKGYVPSKELIHTYSRLSKQIESLEKVFINNK